MTDFFNKKEDVINIVLTPLGKKLYSEGEFDPEYYSFHDNDILYDRQHIELKENTLHEEEFNVQFGNYSINERIKNSLSFKAQETNQSFERNTNLENIERKREDFFPIGISEFNNPYSPAFDVKLFRGNMTGTHRYISGSFTNNRIPEIEIEVTDLYDDVNKLFETDEYFVLRIRELNSNFEKENFDIEIYEINYSYERVNEFLFNITRSRNQLNFVTEDHTLKDDPTSPVFSSIPNNTEIMEDLGMLGVDKCEYYFHLSFDKDILDDFLYEENPNLPEVEDIKKGIKIC